LKKSFLRNPLTPKPPVKKLSATHEGRKNRSFPWRKISTKIEDPFLRKALSLARRRHRLHELRAMMELELTQSEKHAEADVKVFEAPAAIRPPSGSSERLMGLIQE